MSVTSVIELWNLALGAAGAPGRISQIDENTREREVCARWYPQVLDIVQEAAYWPACKTYASLALLGERDTSLDWTAKDPPPDALYKFALPSDLLRPRTLSDFSRFDVVFLDGQRVLSTNSEVAVLEYTRRSELIRDWTAGQKQATLWGLAAHIGPELTGKQANINRAMQMADAAILAARSTAANSTQRHQETIPDWLQQRGTVYGAFPTRYFYPYGALFSEGIASAS